jgi:hypothetical protein
VSIARRLLDILPYHNLSNIHPFRFPKVSDFLGVVAGGNLRGVMVSKISNELHDNLVRA